MRRAFSLIEIMIVVALIALLASVVLPTAFGALRRGQMAQTFDALNDALIEASADASRRGVPVRVNLERAVGDQSWSLWVREDSGRSDLSASLAQSADDSPFDQPPLAGGPGLGPESESPGRLISAFPIDVEIGVDDSEQPIGDEPTFDDGLEAGGPDILTLAVVLPGGRVLAGNGLLLDEAEGDRRWRVDLDELASRFIAVEIQPQDGLGGFPSPDERSEQDEFGFNDEWFQERRDGELP